jgi:hypothetical protein
MCTKCGIGRPVVEFYIQDKVTGRLNPWCKVCYRTWYAGRGGYQTTRTVGCQWCDTIFETPYARSKFCSMGCKGASAAARRRGDGPRKPNRCCVHCGRTLPRTMRADAKFCSMGCNSAAHAVTRKMAKRAGRPRLPGSPLFERDLLGARDGYVCGICHLPVEMLVAYPDPSYGSVDHIVPVSAGGSNDLSNLQLAHLSCNLRKGGRLI